MSFALSGIASGLDSASLVNQLIALEAQPQRLLQNQSATFSKQVTAFQGLNTRVASIADAAKALVKGDAIKSTAGTSTDESITVKAGTTATPANLAVKVDRLASGQTAALSAAPLAATASRNTTATAIPWNTRRRWRSPVPWRGLRRTERTRVRARSRSVRPSMGSA